MALTPWIAGLRHSFQLGIIGITQKTQSFFTKSNTFYSIDSVHMTAESFNIFYYDDRSRRLG